MMAKSASILRNLRLMHLYVGVLIAPAVLFFALTGALQTFNLHETTRGSSYEPPRWIVVLGQIHKKQTAVLPPRRPAPTVGAARPEAAGERAAAAAPPPAQPMARQRHPLPLKIFFLVVSIGLFVSTLSGIWMTYAYQRNRRLITALLLLGAVLPVVLVFV